MRTEIRYATNPFDVKSYDTNRIRKEFLFSNIFEPGTINLVYSYQDRFIVGGIMPLGQIIPLSVPDMLKADFFLARREMGIVNIGGPGKIIADGQLFELLYKDALYLGMGAQVVEFVSDDDHNPALFYLNSAPAHYRHPNKLITRNEALVTLVGAPENSNARKINKLIVCDLVTTCQLQMGLTELQPGSTWNTMPPHIHDRRNEVYFYFNIPEGQAVCHFMGESSETRHIWVHNLEGVISPNWSIHAAAGTSDYCFIWGMAGENLDYSDMDAISINALK